MGVGCASGCGACGACGAGGAVMWAAQEVGGVEVVLAWAQVPASEVVVGRRVCEPRRSAPVEDGLASDVAR